MLPLPYSTPRPAVCEELEVCTVHWGQCWSAYVFLLHCIHIKAVMPPAACSPRFSSKMYYFSCIFCMFCSSLHSSISWSVSWQVFCFHLQGFYGKYCECDDNSCILGGGKLCSGHGLCKCGKCQCNADWTDEACNCTLSTDGCRTSEGSEVCSGHGHCSCGKCRCDTLYTGKYCEALIPSVSVRHFIPIYEGILMKKTLCLCCLCSFLCVTKTFRTNNNIWVVGFCVMTSYNIVAADFCDERLATA